MAQMRTYFRSGLTLILLALITFYLFSNGSFLPPDGKLFDTNICNNAVSDNEVFDDVKSIDQHDCRLLNYIRNNYLVEPSTKPYNLTKPNVDPNRNEGQNKIVLEILNNTRNGFFIECGAWDGERLSATLRLERDFGWTGLLVEPNSISFAQLQTKGRKAWSANICLSTTNHPQKYNVAVAYLSIKQNTQKCNLEI